MIGQTTLSGHTETLWSDAGVEPLFGPIHRREALFWLSRATIPKATASNMF